MWAEFIFGLVVLLVPVVAVAIFFVRRGWPRHDELQAGEFGDHLQGPQNGSPGSRKRSIADASDEIRARIRGH